MLIYVILGVIIAGAMPLIVVYLISHTRVVYFDRPVTYMYPFERPSISVGEPIYAFEFEEAVGKMHYKKAIDFNLANRELQLSNYN